MKFAKNKLVLIGVILVIVVLGAAYYYTTSNSEKIQVSDVVEEEAIKMNPEDIELELTPSKGNKEVIMKINDVSKFDSFEYEMNYDATVDGEVVPRGAIGSGEVEGGKPIERKITIGTCSSGTCKYDQGVTKVSFIIRLNLKDGKIAVVEDELEFSE